MGDILNSVYATAQKFIGEDKGWYNEASTEEAGCMLHIIKNVRRLTSDYFSSILNNQGVGVYQPKKGCTFHRNLLFTTTIVRGITKIYTPDWLDEITWGGVDDPAAIVSSTYLR